VLSRPSGTRKIFFCSHPGLGSAKGAEPSLVAARGGAEASRYDSWPSHSGLYAREEKLLESAGGDGGGSCLLQACTSSLRFSFGRLRIDFPAFCSAIRTS